MIVKNDIGASLNFLVITIYNYIIILMNVISVT